MDQSVSCIFYDCVAWLVCFHSSFSPVAVDILFVELVIAIIAARIDKIVRRYLNMPTILTHSKQSFHICTYTHLNLYRIRFECWHFEHAFSMLVWPLWAYSLGDIRVFLLFIVSNTLMYHHLYLLIARWCYCLSHAKFGIPIKFPYSIFFPRPSVSFS